MLIRRLGNKARVADKIWPLFPEHKCYIELFFGVGGMFFAKPRAPYNFLNDLDGDIFNVYQILTNEAKTAALVNEIELLPICQRTWEHFKKLEPKDEIQKALRFLFLSNFGYMGKPETLYSGPVNSKKILLQNIVKTVKEITQNENNFLNTDFRTVLPKLHKREVLGPKGRPFVYADPPYLGTGSNYNTPEWQPEDAADLFALLANFGEEHGGKFAISEFAHPYILELSEKFGLQVNEIGERQNIKNRRTEVLITNYNVFGQSKMF